MANDYWAYPWETYRGVDDPESNSDGFEVAHPDRGAENIPCIEINSGLNADFTQYKESAYIRCRKCGFIMNTQRFPKGWGTGISFEDRGLQGWGTGAWGGNYEPNVSDPVVKSGCPFCSTYIYD